jgi:hypothetical protein
MIRKFKIAMAVALLAAVAVPMFASTSNAGDYGVSQSYDHKHDTHGW